MLRPVVTDIGMYAGFNYIMHSLMQELYLQDLLFFLQTNHVAF